MYVETHGDIWATNGPAHAIVVPTNARGIMGAGLARQAVSHAPHQSRLYSERAPWAPGSAHIVTYYPQSEPLIIFAATKDRWQDPSEIRWVKSATCQIVALISHLELTTIAVPALGCGLGGLRWSDVKPTIQSWARLGPGGVFPTQLNCTWHVFPPR